MKKLRLSFVVLATVMFASCGSETKTTESGEGASETEEAKVEENKFDEASADYKMAMVLCDCFENFDESDPNAQMDAVGCFLGVMDDPDLQKSEEKGTMEILEEKCPDAHANFNKWQKNMKEEN
jgi:hypothetical protein